MIVSEISPTVRPISVCAHVLRLTCLVVALLVLIFAQVWQIVETVDPGNPPRESLEELFPLSGIPNGWHAQYLPVADSSGLAIVTAQQLGYDEVVHINYTRDQRRITVFAAYWKPGSMSYRMVAGHDPDGCWPGQGWRCIARDRRTLTTPDSEWSFPSTRRGSYTLNGVTENALFWHVVGGRVYIARPNYLLPGLTYIPELFEWGVRQRVEQYFVRITSGESLDQLDRNEMVVFLLSRLAAAKIMGELNH